MLTITSKSLRRDIREQLDHMTPTLIVSGVAVAAGIACGSPKATGRKLIVASAAGAVGLAAVLGPQFMPRQRNVGEGLLAVSATMWGARLGSSSR